MLPLGILKKKILLYILLSKISRSISLTTLFAPQASQYLFFPLLPFHSPERSPQQSTFQTTSALSGGSPQVPSSWVPGIHPLGSWVLSPLCPLIKVSPLVNRSSLGGRASSTLWYRLTSWRTEGSDRSGWWPLA